MSDDTTPPTGEDADLKGVPSWAKKPFEEFLDATERLDQLVHLSVRGIAALRGMPQLLEAIADARGELRGTDEAAQETDPDRLTHARKEAELAQREVDEEFPVLHGQATIAVWAALESAVRLFVARWIENYKPASEVEEVQKLRVKLGEYERLQGEERYFYIVDRLEQELSSPLRSGVTRFETLLSPFGLSAEVDETARRDIFELNNVRNLLVHRSGIADRRFVDACPWLGLKVGERLKLDHRAYSRYGHAAVAYATQLIYRVGDHFGQDLRPGQASQLNRQATEPS
ncbi:MAG: hypothetical protein M3547_13280 [Acidobacteriota bacterium]|nr:hypothetical protein [Acidobacteriota bacterium]